MIFERDPKEEVERAFALFDQNNKGKISLEDLRHVSEELGENVPDDILRSMIEYFDTDGDGMINREEFLDICLG